MDKTKEFAETCLDITDLLTDLLYYYKEDCGKYRSLESLLNADNLAELLISLEEEPFLNGAAIKKMIEKMGTEMDNILLRNKDGVLTWGDDIYFKCKKWVHYFEKALEQKSVKLSKPKNMPFVDVQQIRLNRIALIINIESLSLKENAVEVITAYVKKEIAKNGDKIGGVHFIDYVIANIRECEYIDIFGQCVSILDESKEGNLFELLNELKQKLSKDYQSSMLDEPIELESLPHFQCGEISINNLLDESYEPKHDNGSKELTLNTSSKPEAKKRGRRKDEFRNNILVDDKDGVIKELKIYIPKNGVGCAGFGRVIKVCVSMGILLKKPSATSIESVFGNIGAISGFNKAYSNNCSQEEEESIKARFERFKTR